MINIVSRIFSHISHRRKIHYILLYFLMVIVSLLDIISIGAIIPFLSVLMNPEKLFNSNYLFEFIKLFKITSPEELKIPITIVFVSTAIISGIFRMILLFFTTRLSYNTGSDLAVKVYTLTLYQPYSTHISRNSSGLINVMASKVNGLIQSVILPSINLISSLTMLFFSFIILILINPTITIFIFGFFCGIYILISSLIKNKIKFYGEIASKEHSKIVKLIMEGLGGIRDILLDNNQKFYSDLYLKSDIPLRKAQGFIVFISTWPRYIMEMIGIIFLSLFALNLAINNDSLTNFLPMFGLLVLGSQRLLPIIQQVYQSWSSIIGSKSSAIDTLDFLDQKIPDELYYINDNAFDFNYKIQLNDVSFRYSENPKWVLKNINFEINKGDRIGLKGVTGSGKSTLADIIMGLLLPTEGKILIDGVELNPQNLRTWQNFISHVPQNIYLSDTSIIENIAFGVSKNKIDYDFAIECAKKAKIFDAIDNMPHKFETIVGERGSKLSGGQRQRIGIARAFYKNAKIIVFDEATNALDNETERMVIDSINSTDKVITLIFIAHRLSTLDKCNKIIKVDGGKIIVEKS